MKDIIKYLYKKGDYTKEDIKIFLEANLITRENYNDILKEDNDSRTLSKNDTQDKIKDDNPSEDVDILDMEDEEEDL